MSGGDYPDMLMLTHVIHGSMTERSPDRALTAQAGSIVIGPYAVIRASCHPCSGVHSTVYMWSVKLVPKPGADPALLIQPPWYQR